jgi:DNA helicase-2/ATP-dependent DNA helicase PcrA
MNQPGSNDPRDPLADLDDQQRQVAEALRGPVAVFAGAGAGKTRTITHRIAHGVRSGVYDANRIMSLSFTRKAAGELQSRLRGLGVSGIRAQTFHSAALSQLGFFWPQITGGKAPHLLPGKVHVLSQVVEGLNLGFSPETLRDTASEIEWRKITMRSIGEYESLLESGSRPVPFGMTGEQLIDIMSQYESVKNERRAIDFEDVLILTAGMIETEPRVALQVREQYRFFTVDEYQDVSPLQHTLLQAWLGERDELCVVGDASQTIYSFAGASSRYLLRFAHEHPSARTFKLENNYRSTPDIIALANRLMRDRPGALQLLANREASGAEPSALWFEDEHAEAAAVAWAIREQLRAGHNPADIAVLARTNAQHAAMEAALAAEGIASQMHGATRFFDRADIRQAVLEVRAQSVVPDGRPAFQVVSDVVRGLGWQQEPPRSLAQREKWNALNALVVLAEQSSAKDLRELSEELLERQRAGHEPRVAAVTLSAIHSAKGLEWPIVYVIGAQEGTLPIYHANSEADISEERRLTYVAFTRAQNELRISGSRGSRRSAREPSRFLAEAGISVREITSG